MKRFWIGLTVLSLLLLWGIGASFFLERHHSAIQFTVYLAAEAALKDDMPQAGKQLEEAQRQWDQCRCWTAALVEHGILEEVDALMAEANIYLQTGDSRSLARTCARLAILLNAIAQSHHFSWQNVL